MPILESWNRRLMFRVFLVTLCSAWFALMAVFAFDHRLHPDESWMAVPILATFWLVFLGLPAALVLGFLTGLAGRVRGRGRPTVEPVASGA